jgi:hypothetical protein
MGNMGIGTAMQIACSTQSSAAQPGHLQPQLRACEAWGVESVRQQEGGVGCVVQRIKRSQGVGTAACLAARFSPNATARHHLLSWRHGASAVAVHSQHAGAVVLAARHMHHLCAARVFQASTAK